MFLLCNLSTVHWWRWFVCSCWTLQTLLVRKINLSVFNKERLMVFFASFFCSGNCYRQHVNSIEKSSAAKSIDSPTSLSEILAPSSSTHRISRTNASGSMPSSQKTLPHSIRLVEIPWSSENKGAIRLQADENNQNGLPSTMSTKCSGVRISE